jgi:hypothetical protein
MSRRNFVFWTYFLDIAVCGTFGSVVLPPSARYGGSAQVRQGLRELPQVAGTNEFRLQGGRV